MKQDSAISALRDEKCISLTTFKRDGSRVATPIWLNVMNEKIYVTTEAESWKLKRVKNNPRVEFAACTQRGKVTGPVFTGTARVLGVSEIGPVLDAKRRRYFMFRIISLFRRNQVAIEIAPDR
jgi:PPOX class probable F420-dependent enzyme